MPVVGLSETRRLPRLGKIRLGIKIRAAGGERPKAVDYFVCPPEVQVVYGEQPRSLPIILPANEIEANMPVDLKRYGPTQGLVCKGNGETADAVNPGTGELVAVRCAYKACAHYRKKHCREIGVLSFLLPEVPGFGVWQICTSSYNSIVNLQSEMALAKRICGGRLAGIPFNLAIEPQEAQPGGKKTTIYVMHLRSDMPLVRLRALPPFEAAPATAVPVSDEMPDDLYPELMDEPADSSGPSEWVVGRRRKPLNVNGDSELPEQRQAHIAGTRRGLTGEGFREWLQGEFGTRRTRDLTREQCLAAIAAVGGLTDPQVEGYNRVGGERRELRKRASLRSPLDTPLA